MCTYTYIQMNKLTTQEWSMLYYEASIAKVDREERIEEVAELIEKVSKNVYVHMNIFFVRPSNIEY